MKPEPPARRDAAITVASLRAFATVVEAGGFSAAAVALGLSQPSVSAQVQNLEDSCGLRLLHRRGRLELTDAGRLLLPRARLALARIDEFAAAAGDIGELRAGRLVLGFSAPKSTMKLLARFRAAHPAIEIATRIGNTSSLLADLAECRADVSVMTCAELPTDHEVVVIARERLGLAVRQDDPLAELGSVRLDDPRIGTIVQRESGSMTRALFERGLHSTVRPRTIEVGSREAMKEAVAAGLGHGPLFESETGDDPRLAFVTLLPEVTGAICAVCLREMAAVPAVAAFLSVAANP